MKIIVAYGGVSPEREVSLNSGAAVGKALEQAGFDVAFEDVKSPADFIRKWPSLKADGVFMALHGGWGENGRLQTCLEAFGIPYTGSGPEACMLAMDKNMSKLVFCAHRIQVPSGIIKHKDSKCGNREVALLGEYGYLIVKPNDGGSTVSVSKVSTLDELNRGLREVWKVGNEAIVEAFIPGSEITVTVWEREDGEVVALPAIDIRPEGGFYDYEHKYTSGATQYLCPAQLLPAVAEQVAILAKRAHCGLGCRVYSRVDFRVTASGDVYMLELNTAPGMTATSLVPKSAAAAGVSFSEFVKSLINVSFSIDRGI